jgi:hypothetical protein
MKKASGFIVVIVAIWMIACSSGEQGELTAETEVGGGVQWAQLSLEDAQVQAANQNKLIMVDVFSPT